MLLIFTREKPLGYLLYLHDMMLLGYVQAGLCNIYWCRLPYFSGVIRIVFWMVKGEWKEICLRKGTSEYFAVNPTACLVQNRGHQLFPKLSKNFASKWLRSAAGKSKTSTMLPLFIEDKYRWNVFISLTVISYLSCFPTFKFFLASTVFFALVGANSFSPKW